MKKDLQYYLSLSYRAELLFDSEDEIYIATSPELPGCTAHGSTAVDAFNNLSDSREDWITDALRSGEDIPEPDTCLPSGKWLQRVPRTMHKALIARAQREGVSLNQLAMSYIASGLAESPRESQYEAIAIDANAEPAITAGVTLVEWSQLNAAAYKLTVPEVTKQANFNNSSVYFSALALMTANEVFGRKEGPRAKEQAFSGYYSDAIH